MTVEQLSKFTYTPMINDNSRRIASKERSASPKIKQGPVQYSFQPNINENSRKIVGEDNEPRWNLLYEKAIMRKQIEDKRK